MEEKGKEKILGALEALLFMNGDPIHLDRAAQILESEKEAVKEAANILAGKLADEERGLALVFSDERVQLVTKPSLAPMIEKFVKGEFEEGLTPAAIETLSIVAYLGPISRPKIDYLRGVNSSYTLRNLMMRGLVEKTADSANAHVPLYQASIDLIRHLGVAHIEDLPDYHKYKELIAEA